VNYIGIFIASIAFLRNLPEGSYKKAACWECPNPSLLKTC